MAKGATGNRLHRLTSEEWDELRAILEIREP